MRSSPWQLICPACTVTLWGTKQPSMSRIASPSPGSGRVVSAVKIFSAAAARTTPVWGVTRCSMPQSSIELGSCLSSIEKAARLSV